MNEVFLPVQKPCPNGGRIVAATNFPDKAQAMKYRLITIVTAAMLVLASTATSVFAQVQFVEQVPQMTPDEEYAVVLAEFHKRTSRGATGEVTAKAAVEQASATVGILSATGGLKLSGNARFGIPGESFTLQCSSTPCQAWYWNATEGLKLFASGIVGPVNVRPGETTKFFAFDGTLNVGNFLLHIANATGVVAECEFAGHQVGTVGSQTAAFAVTNLEGDLQLVNQNMSTGTAKNSFVFQTAFLVSGPHVVLASGRELNSRGEITRKVICACFLFGVTPPRSIPLR